MTISRQAGAGAFTIAGMVAEKLQQLEGRGSRPWAAFDRDLVGKVLEEHRLPGTMAKYMPEDGSPVLQSALEEVLGLHPSAWTLAQKTSETMRRLAMRGSVVLVGRGGNLISADLPHVFHVRLVAPLKTRVRHIREFHHLSQSEAEEYVEANDRARKRYVKQHLAADIDDPLGYHLILNTGFIEFERAADIIAAAALAEAAAV